MSKTEIKLYLGQRYTKPGAVVCAYSSSSLEAEAEESQI